MKVFFHSYHSDSLVGALDWSNTGVANIANRSKNSMKVINAIDLVVEVNSEWNSIKTFIAHTTAKAPWMIKLTHRL